MKNKLIFKDQLNEAMNYLSESKNYFYAIIFLFLVGGFYGYFNFHNLEFLQEIIKKLIIETENLNGFEITLFIIQNNVKVAFLGIVFGFFLGIFPFINAIGNGIMIGYVSRLVSNEVSILELWRLFPHGIFELPAIFISLGLGLKLGFTIFSKSDKFELIKSRFYKSLNVFLMIILPLLFLAGIIEGILISLS